MSEGVIAVGSSIVAVYPDHTAAEQAVRRLHEEGFAMADLSIIGRDFQMSEEPVGFVDASQYAKAGAGTGAWFGGLFGLMVGAAAVLVPGVGPVVVAGPLAAALMAGLEGAIAGTALGGLAGALVGWGVPRERAAALRAAHPGRQVPGRRPRDTRGHRSRPRAARLRDLGPRQRLRADRALTRRGGCEPRDRDPAGPMTRRWTRPASRITIGDLGGPFQISSISRGS